MATLKEHQAAMVDLLANGSGIPASASRLAHAMHDVLATILAERIEGKPQRLVEQLISDESNYGVNNLLLKVGATTPGLNDKALSKPQKALKTDRPAKWPTPAEQRVKELENTVKQLKANLVHERACVAELRVFLESAKKTETKLRQEIYNVEQHRDAFRADLKRTDAHVADLISRLPEHAGCRKEDTQVCEHIWIPGEDVGRPKGYYVCSKCGATEL